MVVFFINLDCAVSEFVEKSFSEWTKFFRIISSHNFLEQKVILKKSNIMPADIRISAGLIVHES